MDDKDKEQKLEQSKTFLRDIAIEMRENYINYSMSVIVARALPDVRDGLKPVHRRILYAMHELNLYHNSAYKKSAKTVGDVIGKYHPHGDVAVYDAMVRMAQDFNMRYTLIDGQGNWGSVDGDSPAAMRYTESRLQKITAEMLKDIDKETVNFVDNYDASEKEPQVLPSLLPNLLLNGADGIAVGMATKIPTHNLGEVVDALIYMVDTGNQYVPLPEHRYPRFESNVELKELMKFVKGPDFPTGGIIYNKEDIQNVYATGRGRIVMRAVVDMEEIKGGKSHIVVTQLPYQVNKARLATKIAELVKSEKIVGISDIRDESNREGMRLVIEVKKEARPNHILNLLYKHTEIQSAFNANMLALVNGEPKILTLKNILEEFITHRQEIVIRRTEFDLRKAKERAHILEGYKIAIDNLDAVIKTIRESADADVARGRLMERFNLSQIQAQAILDLQLRRLAALEIKKIEEEYKAIMELITRLEFILANPSEVLKIIKEELTTLRENFADPRKTKVIAGKVGELTQEDTVPLEETIITISHKGYIKRINPDTYKVQHRGGKGILGVKTKEEDYVSHALVCDTHSNVLLFTNKGKVYQLKCYEIPEAQRTSKGTSLMNLVNLENEEIVTSVLTKGSTGFKEETETLAEKESEQHKFLFMATRKGIVKKTDIAQFDDIRKSGVIAIVLEKGDELAWVKPTNGSDEILLITEAAHSIHFNESDVRETGRATMGVMGIRIKNEDKVIGMDVVKKDIGRLFTISENGYGKMTELKEYTLQGRGGQGILTARVGAKNGKLVIAKVLDEELKELIILSRKGQAIRIGIENIPILGRQTSGVRLMKLPTEDKVAALTAL